MISSDNGDLICTPSLNIPMSLIGVSCFEDTDKFWDNGILLRILSDCSFLSACDSKIKLWSCVEVVPIPICTVLAVPIWLRDLYNAIFDIFAPTEGVIGST